MHMSDCYCIAVKADARGGFLIRRLDFLFGHKIELEKIVTPSSPSPFSPLLFNSRLIMAHPLLHYCREWPLLKAWSLSLVSSDPCCFYYLLLILCVYRRIAILTSCTLVFFFSVSTFSMSLLMTLARFRSAPVACYVVSLRREIFPILACGALHPEEK